MPNLTPVKYLPAVGAWMVQALYTASPIDLIPDIIPVLGLIDDFFGLLLVIGFTAVIVYRARRQDTGPNPQGNRDLVPPEQINPIQRTGGEYEPMSLDEIRAW